MFLSNVQKHMVNNHVLMRLAKNYVQDVYMPNWVEYVQTPNISKCNKTTEKLIHYVYNKQYCIVFKSHPWTECTKKQSSN